MIKPYLNDIINDHKIPKNLRVHSSYEVTDYETQFGEWKIANKSFLFLLKILEKLLLCVPRVIV